MENYTIPSYVISALADTISQAETHASLHSLFMYANAPGEPPEGSKAVKALEWLKRINKESGSDSLAIIGRIIEKYLQYRQKSTTMHCWTCARKSEIF